MAKSPKLLTPLPRDSSDDDDWRKESPKLGQTVLDDLGSGELRRSFETDLQDIYNFYLDDRTRDSLEDVHPITRVGYILFWVVKSAIFRLNPARRILLLMSIVLFAMSFGGSMWSLVTGFLSLLFVLFLELKDKLLAQDELQAGRVVQEALIPRKSPKVDGWDVFLYTRPANEVGGDLVDYQRFEDGRVSFALGDVAGKGLGAALYMAKLQSAMRAIAPGFTSASEIATELNTISRRDGLRDKFVSLAYMLVAPDSGKVQIANAGHFPPIVVNPSGPKILERGGPAIGMIDNPVFAEQMVELEEGDTLIVYSDGLTEARNEEGDFFTEQRLTSLLARLCGLPADAIGNRLLGYLDVFVGDARQTDDLSLIVLQRK